MTTFNDVATNFLRGISLGKSFNDDDRKWKLAEAQNNRAQEQHDAQMWRENQARSFADSYEQYNMTGDPNAFLDYAKTYHPNIFPDPEAGYTITKDGNTGDNTLFMTGKDGNTTPVTTPSGTPVQFTDENMQQFLTGHVDPKALTSVYQSKLKARGDIEGAKMKVAAASLDQGMANAMGLGQTGVTDLGGALYQLDQNAAAGTVSVGNQPLANKSLPPGLHVMPQGNQLSLVQTGGALGSPETVGTYATGMPPGDQARLAMSLAEKNSQAPTKAQNLMAGKLRATLSVMNGILSQFGGNGLEIDLSKPMDDTALAGAFSSNKGYAKLKEAAKSDPQAQKLLEAYDAHMRRALEYSEIINAIGMPPQQKEQPTSALGPNMPPQSPNQKAQDGSIKSPDAQTDLPEGARQAQDGHWYIPDPNRPGKYLKVR